MHDSGTVQLLTLHILMPMAEQCTTLVVHRWHANAQHPRVMLYDINSCFGCWCVCVYIYIYTMPYTIA